MHYWYIVDVFNRYIYIRATMSTTIDRLLAVSISTYNPLRTSRQKTNLFVALFLVFITISNHTWRRAFYSLLTQWWLFQRLVRESDEEIKHYKTLREYIVLERYIKFGIEKTYYLWNARTISTFHGYRNTSFILRRSNKNQARVIQSTRWLMRSKFFLWHLHWVVIWYRIIYTERDIYITSNLNNQIVDSPFSIRILF